MHQTFFFPPLFSFHHHRLSIRLVATCEQTARGIPRRTSGRVPATPRWLTLSISRRVFAAVLAFVFFFLTQANSTRGRTTLTLILISPGVTKFQEDPYSGLRPSPRGPVRPPFLQVELFYFFNYENKRTYLYIFMYQIPFSANRSLLLVPTGPLRDEGRLLCHGILIAGDRGRAQLVFTLFTL